MSDDNKNGEQGSVQDTGRKQQTGTSDSVDQFQEDSILRRPLPPSSTGVSRVEPSFNESTGTDLQEPTPSPKPTSLNAEGDRPASIPPVESKANAIAKPAEAKGTIGPEQIPIKPPDGKGTVSPTGADVRPLQTAPASEKPLKEVQSPSNTKLTGSDQSPSQAAFAARTQGAQPGDSGALGTQPKIAQDAKGSEPVRTNSDSAGVNKVVPAADQTATVNKGTVASQGDRPAAGESSGIKKSDSPTPSAVEAAFLPPGHRGDTATANAGAKQDIKPEARPTLSQGIVTAAESQAKSGVAKSDSQPVALSGVVQPRVEPQKVDQAPAGQQKIDQNKFEPVKGSDYIRTSGTQGSTQKQDAVKPAESKVDSGRLIEQAGSKEPAPIKDPKSSGVFNETIGAKPESGSKIEPASKMDTGSKIEPSSSSQNTGIKQDTGAKADQITKGIEGRVNEGAKQPSGDTRVPTSETSTGKQPGQFDVKQPNPTDVRQPNQSDIRQPSTTDGPSSGGRQPGIEGGGKSQGITDGAQSGVKQTGTADSTSTTGKHPAASDNAGASGKQPGVPDGSTSTVRQPLHEAGDKASGSGGGGGIAAESTKRIDISAPSGGRADGQSGAGAMGGGSSAPIDRAPHKPFSVEDAQPSSKADGGFKGDANSGGKGATGGAGPRFDTGEVRGNEPGARFDTPELKDGRGGMQPGGVKTGDVAGGKPGDFTGVKGGDSNIVKGSDAGIIKSTDVSGIKGSSADGQGVGGSSGSDGGILSDKRQPSMLPDGMVNQGGKSGKVGDGVTGGTGHVSGDESVPLILPGALSGKGALPVSGKGDAATCGKGDVAIPGKGDTVVSGKGDVVSGKVEPALPGAKKAEAAGAALAGAPGEKNDQSKDLKEKGQKADAAIAAGLAGQVGVGAADVGSVLKNFAQAVLADGKSGVQAGEGSKDSKVVSQTPAAADGKEIPLGRQDFAGPGQKTRILDNQTPTGSDTKIIRGTPAVSGTPGIPGTHGAPSTPVESTAARGPVVPGGPGMELGGDDGVKFPVEEFELPPVDLLGEDVEQGDGADESDKLEEADESLEAKLEDEMQYELALGLQIYTTIAEAQYGAYHYLTKEGDTVEGVASDVVGDGRCAPLVFSLNKEHILASTEYGVHPFKVGVMVQLPTPRELKEFFGGQ